MIAHCSYTKMPYCVQCGKRDTKVRKIVNNVCSDCTHNNMTVQVIGNQDTTNSAMNLDESAINQDNTGSTIVINDAYWIKLNSLLDAKIKTIEDKYDAAIDGLDCKVETLKCKCKQYEEDISTLKSIVGKQQKSLNQIDADERDHNIIISGLSESDISHGETVYNTDVEKVSELLNKINLTLPAGNEIVRLGKPNSNYNRILKVNVVSKENRNTILAKAKDLKNADEPWCRTFLKRDLHPVIVQENSRLNRKKKELLKLDENQGKNVRIEKGKLMIDGVVVDQNLFFV